MSPPASAHGVCRRVPWVISGSLRGWSGWHASVVPAAGVKADDDHLANHELNPDLDAVEPDGVGELHEPNSDA